MGIDLEKLREASTRYLHHEDKLEFETALQDGDLFYAQRMLLGKIDELEGRHLVSSEVADRERLIIGFTPAEACHIRGEHRLD